MAPHGSSRPQSDPTCQDDNVPFIPLPSFPCFRCQDQARHSNLWCNPRFRASIHPFIRSGPIKQTEEGSDNALLSRDGLGKGGRTTAHAPTGKKEAVSVGGQRMERFSSMVFYLPYLMNMLGIAIVGSPCLTVGSRPLALCARFRSASLFSLIVFRLGKIDEPLHIFGFFFLFFSFLNTLSDCNHPRMIEDSRFSLPPVPSYLGSVGTTREGYLLSPCNVLHMPLAGHPWLPMEKGLVNVVYCLRLGRGCCEARCPHSEHHEFHYQYPSRFLEGSEYLTQPRHYIWRTCGCYFV